MAVLAYSYSTAVCGSDTEAAETGAVPYLSTSPIAASMAFTTSVGSATETFKRRFGKDSAGSSTVYLAGNNSSAAQQTDWGLFAEIPAGTTELWIRFQDWFWTTAAYGTFYSDFVLARFLNYDGTKWVRVGELYLEGNTTNVRYRFFNAAGTAVTKTMTVTTLDAVNAYEATVNENINDFRFVFDADAGYIQHYDYTASRKGETIGATIGTVPITHVILSNNTCNSFYSYYTTPLSRIIANEPTFGMFVMPIFAKGEGSYQQHTSGTYARFSMNRKDIDTTNYVGLQKPTDGSEVAYSFIPKTPAEMGLPANYNILSLSWRAAVDATSADGATPTTKIFMKHKPSGNIYDVTLGSFKANVASPVSSRPQVRKAVFEKNPYTGQSWLTGDFADFEVGFKI